MNDFAAKPGFFESMDWPLLFAVVLLLAAGIVMVASASFMVAERQMNNPWFFIERHSVYVLLGLLIAAMTSRVPVVVIERSGPVLMLVGFVLLILVLIPGVGRTVNGATRWIGIGGFTLQISEFVKLFVVIYLSGYLVRRGDEVRSRMSGFLKPMGMMLIISALLLAEPDFGAAAVMLTTVMVMMFLGGVRLLQFLPLLGLAFAAVALVAIAEPYRIQRLTTFLDPWADPFNSGFQLTQALIAIGRGEWFGVGLGESVQKLFYLPEAHTDFLFAILVEEFGVFGGVVVIAGFVTVVWRMMKIGIEASHRGEAFSAYCAQGIGVWLGMQAFVNLGVNTGLLPTKGLTLPLMSYGGTSLLVSLTAVGVVMAIHRSNVIAANAPWRRNIESDSREVSLA